MSKPHVMICVLVAKAGKEGSLEAALSEVAENSRLETTNLEYSLNRDLANPQKFFLYEIWESKEKHAEQFEKDYIKALIPKLEVLLAEPYEAYEAEEI